MVDYKPGDKIWTLEKDKFIERTVQRQSIISVYTELLSGEPTSNPETGMFITFRSHQTLEVGRTQQECLENRIQLESGRITRAIEKLENPKDGVYDI